MKKNNTRNTIDKLRVSESHDNDLLIPTREIFLYRSTDSENDGETSYGSAGRFLKNIQILESINSQPIVIHQCSLGGDWESGMMIYDIIRQSRLSFVFVCHGMAASMGSIIPQSVLGKGKRLTMPHCTWLIHEGEQSTTGTVKQTESFCEFSKTVKSDMYEIYVDACHKGKRFKGKTLSQIKSAIKRKLDAKEDWWLTSTEAVQYGFADGIFGSKNFESIEHIKKLLV